MNTKIPLAILAFLTINNLHAATAVNNTFYSFAVTSSPVALAGSDDGTGNPITYTSTAVTTGTGTAGSEHGDQTPIVGGHTYAGATITDPGMSSPLPTQPGLFALIHASPYADVANGDPGETYNNAIGLHIQFTVPVEISTFAMVDFDGGSVEKREWGTSWAYNSTTATTIAPTVFLNSTTNLSTVNADANALYPTLNAPTSLDFVELSVDVNATPDTLESQAAFDYNYQFVTDVYFLFGAQGDATNAQQRSGVTALGLVAPEPSSTGLLGLGGLVLALRRRK